MKRAGMLRTGMIALACVGMLIPGPALRAAAPSQAAGKGSTPAVLDVALQSGGTLQGQIVDAQGKPLSRTAVSIRQSDREVAATLTDESGRFRASGLRGGMCQVVAGGAVGTYRLWAPKTAPAAARPAALIVVDGQPLVRGNRAMQWLRNPWVIAGIVAVAIAVPVAIHAADDDDKPKSN